MRNPEREFDRLEQRFFDEWMRRNPLLATSLGLHDSYDDFMPDGSLAKLQDDVRFLKRSLEEFERVDPKGLRPSRQVDRDLAVHLLRLWIFELDEQRLWGGLPEAPQTVGLALFQVLYRNYAPLSQRLRSIMKRLERIPEYTRQARTRLHGPVRQLVESELETLSRLPGFFNNLRNISREHLPPTPQRTFHRLIEDVQTALDEYENWLIVDAKPTYRDAWAVGEEKFRKLLELRGIEEAPLTLLKMGEEEIGRLREKLRELGSKIKRKVLMEDVREIVRQQHPETIDGVVRYAREAMQKARQFVARSKFAQMPEHETLYITETPTFLHHMLPWGTYFGPAKFEQKIEGYFCVTPGDCDSDKLKEHNYAAILDLAVHETYPGHHLQSAWVTKAGSLLRLLANAPETREGWAAYCEERVKDMGFEDTPSSRFMMTLHQLLRAARMVLDVKLSTGKLGYQPAIENLIDTVGMDRVAAEAEIRRYLITPGVPLSYHYGKEKIKELKKWAKEKMRGRWSETFFHTAVLQAGALPIKLLKRDLEWRIEEELKRPPPPKDDGKRDKGRKGKPQAKTAPAAGPPKKNGAKTPPPKPAPAKAAPRPKAKPAKPAAKRAPARRAPAKRRPAAKPVKRRP